MSSSSPKGSALSLCDTELAALSWLPQKNWGSVRLTADLQHLWFNLFHLAVTHTHILGNEVFCVGKQQVWIQNYEYLQCKEECKTHGAPVRSQELLHAFSQNRWLSSSEFFSHLQIRHIDSLIILSNNYVQGSCKVCSNTHTYDEQHLWRPVVPRNQESWRISYLK